MSSISAIAMKVDKALVRRTSEMLLSDQRFVNVVNIPKGTTGNSVNGHTIRGSFFGYQRS